MMCEKYVIINIYIYNVAIVRVIKIAEIKNGNNNSNNNIYGFVIKCYAR